MKVTSLIQRLLFIPAAFFSLPVYSQNPPTPATHEEALFVRRILEFWKDNEPILVKAQIHQFLKLYPTSEYRDSLLVILGDTYWKEKNYKQALTAYDEIKAPHLCDKVFNNRLDCHYHLENHYDITEALLSKLSSEKEPPETNEQALWMFYFAEALLQQAKQMDDPIAANEGYTLSKDYYELLLNTEHKVNAKLALAEIYSLLNQNQPAAVYYLELADLIPEKKEEMIWRAAQLQQVQAPEDGIRLYAQLLQLDGAKSADAAYNKLLLMYALGHYQPIIDEQEELRHYLSSENHPLLAFYIGHSYFHLGQYEKAIDYLDPLFNKQIKLPVHDIALEKSLMMTMLASRYHLNDINQVNYLADKFEFTFPKDIALAGILYFQAAACKNNGQIEKGLNLLNRVKDEFPEYDRMDHVDYERAVILFKLKQWEPSRTAFKELIQKYPDSPLAQTSRQYLPNTTLQIIDATPYDAANLPILKRQLIEEMQAALDFPDSVKGELRPRYFLKIAKTWYELKEYLQAIDTLLELLDKHSDDPNLFQAHLLLATCYHEGLRDPVLFAKHAENVLALNEDYFDQDKLRLNLFSTYLQLSRAEQPSSANENPYIDKAAEHLFEVLLRDQESIKTENQLWLANYFYNKVKSHTDEYAVEPLTDKQSLELAKKGVQIYEKALGILPSAPHVNIQQDTLYLEHETFKLSNLYGWINQSDAQIALLNDLIGQQKENPQWSWTLRSRTIFALANSYRQKGNVTHALENYIQLTANPKTTDPYISSASKLHWARLNFLTLAPEKRHLDDEETINILKTLKDLQLRKSLAQEPLHLEAGIDYAFIRSSLEPHKKQDEQRYFLFTRLKEEFSNQDDLWAKDYNASRKQYPEKDIIYQAYMMLIDAHLLKMEADLAAAKGSSLEQEAKQEAAHAIYKSLIQGKFAVSKYVVDQAKSGFEQTTAFEVFTP